MKGYDLKLMYEKFCFLQRYQEKKLTDRGSQEILRQYGFKLQQQEDILTEVYTRVVLKVKDPIVLQEEDIVESNRDSLQIFWQNSIERTSFAKRPDRG